MLNITEATKAQYRLDNVHKELEIRIPSANLTLNNDNIVKESVNLTESIESGNNLSFTGCIASVFKVSCVNLSVDVSNAYIEVDILADDTEETVPLFRGYVDEVTNPSHEELTTTLTCYDVLYKISGYDVKSWYDSLTFPITIRNFRNSLCTRLGIQQVDDYLPNDSLAIQKTIEDKTISGLTLLKYICQINGRFGQIGRDGKLIYRHLVEGTEALYPREDLYPDNDIFPADENALESINKAHYKNVNFEAYRVNTIKRVQLVNKDGVIAATAGGGPNSFTVYNNPLIYDIATATLNRVATNLYNAVKGLWYTPATVDSIGLPYVECGDFVLVAARYSIIRAYVLTRTLTGIQSLKDKYEAKGTLNQPTYKPNIQTQVTANASKITSEVTRARTAESGLSTSISNESSRARSAESGLQSGINSEASIRAQQINAVNVRCDQLNAQDAQIVNLVAQKANINDLQATNATVGSLVARTANVENLMANKANISDLSATNARVQNLEATRVTAQQVQAYVGSFNYVTAGQVTTAVNSALQGTITCGTLRAGQIYIYDGSGYISLNTYVHRYA